MFLTGYCNLSLTKGKRPHLYTKNVDNLLDYLADNYEVYDIPFDSYRINANICVLSLDNLTDDLKRGVKNLTYIIEHSHYGEPYYFRAYYVDSIVQQSNKLLLQLSVDLWTSFITQADISELEITRCNRNLLYGIYDDIEVLNPFRALDNDFNGYIALGGQATEDASINTIATDYVSLVCVVSCVIASRISGADKTEAVFLVGAPLRNFVNKAVSLDSDIAGRYKPVEIAQRIISGAFAMPTSYWFVNSDIKILKTYVIPNECLSYYRNASGNVDGIAVKFKSVFNPTEEDEISLAYINARTINKVVSINNWNLDINKKYICGLRDKGIDLLRTTESQQQVVYEMALNNDGLHALIKQGEKSLDITSNFEVSLIGNAENTDALQKMAQSMEYASKLLSTFKGFTGTDATSGVQSALGLAKYFDNRAKANASLSNDDGFATYYLPIDDNTKVRYPFMLTYWTSATNEDRKARIKGATFDNFNTPLEQVFHKDFLGSAGTELTFIQAEAEVTKVCESACDFIKGEFRRGIYIYNVDDYFAEEDEI